MKKYLFLILTILTFCLIIGCGDDVKESTPEDGLITNKLTEKEMLKDLDVLEITIKEKHTDFDHKYSETDFNNDLEVLKGKLSSLDSEAFSFEIMKICAKFGDTATRAFLDTNRKGNLYYLPLELSDFEEGLIVTEINIENEVYLGWKLVKIEDTSIDNVISTLSAYYGGESNYYSEYAAKNSIPFWNMLNNAKIVSSKDVKLTLAKLDDSEQKVVTLTAEKSSDIDETKNQKVSYTLPTEYIAKKDSKGNEVSSYYEYKLIDNVLYIQFNICNSDPDKSMESFVKTLNPYLTSKVYKKVVVDFRYNTGTGDYTSGALLYSALKNFKNDGGEVYCLIGKYTQGHAIGALLQIREMCNATIVGTPTIYTTFYYSGKYYFTLPNSVMMITYPTTTTKFIDGNNLGSVIPNVTVKNSYVDYSKGIDTILERVK